VTARRRSRAGPLDVLVNNAARLIPVTATVDTPAELIDTAFSVSGTAAVAFLAGDDAANIHGATLSVDGGYTAR
jgi:NAD(P)-dependent dehydrogenase (short-subunit alcohol dehydrogenase family)